MLGGYYVNIIDVLNVTEHPMARLVTNVVVIQSGLKFRSRISPEALKLLFRSERMTSTVQMFVKFKSAGFVIVLPFFSRRTHLFCNFLRHSVKYVR